ncbi:unnamed protein product [Adineta steineri]|uniref:Kinesin light chain n=1 Tax=Adineta steineri TaxID=433720 RepID=A0A819KGD0_9BILA|nr:unnamed protein product [Adineta steineri]CAF1298537.1 unnamed protein product [Adineta steineri]CAF3945027.1 unnamed protein product [Adineta steineri]CAF4122175.1 unnamed protein product [Adineta steineri]
MEAMHPVKKFKSSETKAISNSSQRWKHMVQDYLLMCLDEHMDKTNKDYKYISTQIQTSTENVSVFTQRDECIDFLSDVQDIKSFLVVKDTTAQQIMLLINDIPQLGGVYIYNDNKTLHEEWIKKWDKIKSVHTNSNDLCQALQLDIKKYNQDSITMSFVTINEMASTDKLNQLEPNFMYTQIFKDILLNMQHNEQAIKYFIAYCRRHDCVSSININRFEKEYNAQTAIWWYTFPSNFFSMLNYGLRTLDADIIITMGFLLRDVHEQIQRLYKQQLSAYGGKSFVVYRGQGLIKSDFEKLQKTKGGLISFNNFLSTSKDKKLPLEYAECASINSDMVGILFIMSIDPRIKSVPFASITEESSFKEEDEILFSMHTIFRVGAIEPMDNENKLYQVELQLTSDDDQQLRLLTDRIRKEVGGRTGWERLGDLLLIIGQFNKAKELYNVLLEQTSDVSEKQYYYNQQGYIHSKEGDYEKAIWYYEQRLEIQRKTLPSNHPALGVTYDNIGSVYDKLGEYSKALSYHEKALAIDEKSLPSNHPNLATSYNNIGLVYNNMGEYSKALSFLEKTLEIFQKTLPSNHPSLATLYNNIGSVYDTLGEYSKALSSHKKALAIDEKSLPSNHYSLAASYNNIGLAYDSMGEYSEALSFYEKSLEICQKTLSSNHPHIATSFSNTASVYHKMGEYSKALSHNEKALEIREKSLPLNYPALAISYNNIGSLYKKMEEYSKALSYCKRALDIWQRVLPSTHPYIKGVKKNIEIVEEEMEKNS